MSSGGPPELCAPDGYDLLETVGVGAFGVVYRARQARSGRLVALKTARGGSVGALSSLRREVRALEHLRHQGVVRILDQGISDGVPWYAMELLSGETLRQWLSRHPPPRATEAEHEALRILLRLCPALAFIHGEGIVHRDLKPEHIFLDRERGPVLVDFGLTTQFADTHERLDMAGAGLGSLDYMAPEQLHGGTVDARADLYSLGCVLYEVLTGRPPFPGGNWSASTPEPVGSPPLDSLVQRLLAFRARERLGHAADLAAALAALVGEEPPPVARGRGYLYRPSFAGRGELAAQLDQIVDHSRQHRGAALFLGGVSGTGKTRLVTEVAARAAARGHRVVMSECEPASQSQPLFALHPLTQALFDHCRVRGEEETEHVIGGRGPLLAAYWPEVATLPGQACYPPPQPLDGRAGRERLLEALVDTLLCFAESRPLLWVLDDLQWADALTLELIERLEADLLFDQPLALVGTYRSDELDERLRRWLIPRPQLRLGPLDQAAIASMIADMLALEEAPAPLWRTVAAHAEGNPLFVAEYLRAAVSERLIERDSRGHWQLTTTPDSDAVSTLRLPDTLRAVIAQRLSRLSAVARGATARAAVLGREFPAEWLEHWPGESEPGESVHELIREEVLEQWPQGRLRFVHDKVREVAYELIDPAERRRLHLVAAHLFEAQPPPREQYAALARHYLLAGRDEPAIDYFERAGEHALTLGAHRDALALFGQALSLGRYEAGAPRRVRWQRLLGEASFAVGDLSACQRHLGEALGALYRPMPRSRPAWMALLIRESVRQAGSLLRPRPPLSRPSGAARAASLAAARLAEAAYFGGQPLVMLTTTVLAANLAERAGVAPEVPRVYAQLGYVAGLLRLGPLVRRYFDRAQGPPRAACVAYIEALLHLDFGRWAQAESAAREALARLEAVEDRQEHEIAQTMLAQAEYFSGRFAAAQARFLLVRDSAEARRNGQHQAWGSYGAARSLMTMGRLIEAAELLHEAARLLQHHADPASELICQGLAAMTARRRGDLTEARRHADRALAQLRAGQPPVFSTLHGYEGALETYLAIEALGPADEVLARLRRFAWSFPMARPGYLRWHAELELRRGRRRRARRGFLSAIGAARHLGMPLQVAEAELSLGQSTLEEGPAAAERLQRTKAQLAQLGCEYHLRMCEAALVGQRRR